MKQKTRVPHFYCARCGAPLKLARTFPPGPNALPGGVLRKWSCTRCGAHFKTYEFLEETYKKISHRQNKQEAARLLEQIRELLRTAKKDCL